MEGKGRDKSRQREKSKSRDKSTYSLSIIFDYIGMLKANNQISQFFYPLT